MFPVDFPKVVLNQFLGQSLRNDRLTRNLTEAYIRIKAE